MNQTTAPQFLLQTRGKTAELDAYVVAVRFSRDSAMAAFAMGDGSVNLVRRTDLSDWRNHPAHDGAILSMTQDIGSAGFITGGDDGALRRMGADGTVSDIATFGMKWVEQVATFDAGNGKGLIAAGVGKTVHLYDQSGVKLKEWLHPSTVTGLTFDGKGKRVAASHYNGATLWFVAAKTDTPRKLEWKGSHTGIAIHPEGEAVVTAMQETALHGWKLPDGQHMRMSGYPAKTESMSFSRGGKWLASSGADSMVLWPFHGGGPMGKAPLELAGGDGIVCQQVACHPQQEIVAGGFADGLIVIADIGSSRIIPVAPPGRGAITALCWSPDGAFLALGTDKGFAGVIDFSVRVDPSGV